MTDLLSLDPMALIILLIAGGGVIYVVRLFTQAQTIREREMWVAIQSIMASTEKMSELWLSAIQSQGDKSSEAVTALSSETSGLKSQVAELTAAINRSIETGASLHGASTLMASILREGNGRGNYEKK